MKRLVPIFLILFYCLAYSQDTLYNKALKAIDEKRWFDAEHLLTKALKNGEDELKCSYELAWTYYCNKEYKKAIDVLTPFLNKKDIVTSDIYQLLGNAYDENNNSYKAVDIYTMGLEQFPDAGNLHLELGNIKYKEGNYREALYWYEKGIEKEPTFSSNYYRAAKVFLMSTEVVWGLLYGEIFMILEPESERSKEFSKDLFSAYKDAISLGTNANVDFNNNIIVYSDSFERKNVFPSVFNSIMLQCVRGKRYINIATLSQIRTLFIANLYRDANDFANPLFEYEKTLIDKGLFDAYNYYLFAYGDTKESSAWINSHKAQWDRLIKYLKTNPIPLTTENYFSRYNME